MKKIIVLLIVLASLSPLFADYDAMQPLTGYIYSNVTFSVSLLDEVFPFNLSDSNFAEDGASPTTVRGLRIGKYTLSSTSTSFKLYVTHDNLKIVERTFGIDDGTISQIDYRLYLQMGSSSVFDCCTSDTSPDVDVSSGGTLSFSNKILISGNSINLQDQNIYICLYDHSGGGTTSDTVNNLMSGTYSSNIYFYLEV